MSWDLIFSGLALFFVSLASIFLLAIIIVFTAGLYYGVASAIEQLRKNYREKYAKSSE